MFEPVEDLWMYFPAWSLIIRVDYPRPLPHLAGNKAEFHNINSLEQCRQECRKGTGYSFKDYFAGTGAATE